MSPDTQPKQSQRKDVVLETTTTQKDTHHQPCLICIICIHWCFTWGGGLFPSPSFCSSVWSKDQGRRGTKALESVFTHCMLHTKSLLAGKETRWLQPFRSIHNFRFRLYAYHKMVNVIPCYRRRNKSISLLIDVSTVCQIAPLYNFRASFSYIVLHFLYISGASPVHRKILKQNFPTRLKTWLDNRQDIVYTRTQGVQKHQPCSCVSIE